MEEDITENTNEISKEPKLMISDVAISYLSETGKWTKFLSILGFVFIGLIVVVGLFAGSVMSFMSNGKMDNIPKGMGFFFGLMYVLMGFLYFFPTWYLFNFSNKLKTAIATKSEDDLTAALINQKSFYKYWGILTIVVLGVYILFGLFALMISSLK